GSIRGGALSAAQKDITAWTAVANGSFKITIDATVKTLSTLDFSGVTNLNGVATIITPALAGATCVWNGTQFVVTSPTTGT
ncbi:DUF3383 family protein, partial [Acinetobacter baumannii]